MSNKVEEYILFLDESNNTPPSKLFALGGWAVKKKTYTDEIIPYMIKLKTDVFGNDNVILHETELRAAHKGYNKEMRKKDKRELFWNGMGNLFDNYDIKVFNAILEPDIYYSKYNSDYLYSVYCISLQTIVENYAHYLEKVNGMGSLCIESRNIKEDNRLQNHFDVLKKRGTNHLNNMAIRKHIGTLSFYEKQDNNIGLQIADFIPNVLKKHAFGEKPRKPSIVCNICNCLYDGTNSNADTFGNKIVY